MAGGSEESESDVRSRDAGPVSCRLWEVEGVRGAGTDTFLDLRLADDRPGPPRLMVVAVLERSLRPEPATKPRFEVPNVHEDDDLCLVVPG